MSINDIKEFKPKILNLLNNKDFTLINSVAHGIKGLAYNFGAKFIGDRARDIEIASKENDADEIKKLLDDFETLINITSKQIDELL